MSKIDTNIDNYSTDDLLEILDLSEASDNEPSEFQIKEAADSVIARMRQQLNFDLVNFFEKVKVRLLKEFGEDLSDDEQDTSNTQISNWWEDQYPSQNNLQQTNKVTDTKQKIQTFNSSSQYPMTREKLGLPTTHPVPVAQGAMNPILKNTTTRIVYIDSQYRQNIYTADGNGAPTAGDPAFNTDFTLDLTDPLTNVISLKLYSFNIPSTWYAFSADRGNNCSDAAWDNAASSNPYTTDGSWETNTAGQVIIPSGNYNTLLDLLETWVLQLETALIIPVGGLVVTVSNNSGIANFENTTGNDMYFLFWKEGQQLCGQSCYGRTYRNQNLAWNMGFRQNPEIPLFEIGLPVVQQHEEILVKIPAGSTISAAVPGDVYGSTHFFLVVDDYNQNHINKGLVSINDNQTKLPVPSYFSPANKEITGTSLVSCDPENPGSNKYSPSPQTTKSAPRKLTQAQIYTANEILANQNKQKDRAYGPTTTDVLAIIPLKYAPTGETRATSRTTSRPIPLIEYTSSLQSNERTYFGPVNIERMRIKLIDDRGNLVNLNDNDWSFSLIVEQLYQY